MTSRIWARYRDSDKQTAQRANSKRAVYENMTVPSSSAQPFTILTEEGGIPGSKFEKEPEKYTVEHLKRWLKCRGLKQSGKRGELLNRVRDCIASGSHRNLEPSIDDGKWYAAKALQEQKAQDKKEKSNLVSLPAIPSGGWRKFPSQDIPALFNYGHVHFYALESIQNAVNSDHSEEGLGHMTDKPMKNGRKYVDSGFVHDTMDKVNDEHYFLRAHVWPSMRNELPHNVVVVLLVISGAVIHASCEPCRASSLGRRSHVVAALFIILDIIQVKKHGAVLSKPCRSKDCSWNKGKKRDKNPPRLSDAVYPSKLRKSAVPVINFHPRPSDYRRVFLEHINRFAIASQSLSQDSDGQNISMWETQLKITYKDYDLADPFTLCDKVNKLRDNLTPSKLMEIPGTQGQSTSGTVVFRKMVSINSVQVFSCL